MCIGNTCAYIYQVCSIKLTNLPPTRTYNNFIQFKFYGYENIIVECYALKLILNIM